MVCRLQRPAPMRSCRIPVSAAHFALICATLGAACSGAVPSGSSVTDGCLEVLTWRDSPTRQETRATWDPELRILTKETRSLTAAAQSVATLKWRYAAEGRIIAYIGVEQPFQHDIPMVEVDADWPAACPAHH